MQLCKQRGRNLYLLKRRMQQIEWRRCRVLELSSKGHNQSEIAKVLQVDKSIISRDISFLREKSKENIRKYIEEKLPIEYEKCLVGINAILKEAWNTVEHSSDKREKFQALSLAKECYETKFELLTNATVVDDALKFVSSIQIDKSIDRTKLDDSILNINTEDDIQISEEENNQSTTTITRNKTF
jgi:transcriptional regulator